MNNIMYMYEQKSSIELFKYINDISLKEVFVSYVLCDHN